MLFNRCKPIKCLMTRGFKEHSEPGQPHGSVQESLYVDALSSCSMDGMTISRDGHCLHGVSHTEYPFLSLQLRRFVFMTAALKRESNPLGLRRGITGLQIFAAHYLFQYLSLFVPYSRLNGIATLTVCTLPC